MSAKKKTTKQPSAKQLAARRKFAAAAKARSKAAKAKRGTKRKPNRTIIKAKRVTVLSANPSDFNSKYQAAKKADDAWQAELKRVYKDRAGDARYDKRGSATPKLKKLKDAKLHADSLVRRPNITSAFDLEYIGDANSAERDGVKGWQLSRKFFARQSGHKTTSPTKTTLLDLTTGSVWKKRAKNPKRKTTKRRNAPDFSAATPIEVSHHYRSGGPGYETRRTRIIKQGQRDLFAPDASIDDLLGYLRKSNPTAISAVKRKLGAKRFATASPSLLKRELKAVLTKELKRRASRKPARKRRNAADVDGKFAAFQGRAVRKDTPLAFPDGAPQELYQLGQLHLIRLVDGRKITVEKGTAWLCADVAGKLHLGTKPGYRLTDAGRGSLGEVARIEYITSKPHLGEPDKTIFFHDLGEESGKRPTLYADGKGGLVFKGGNYTITPEGIRD